MKVYATRFEFDASTGWKPLALATQRWLADPRRFGLGISDTDILCPWNGESQGLGGCNLSIDTFETKGTNLWACRFSHPDSDAADRCWTTHVGVRLTEKGGVCSVFLDLEATGHTITMQRFTPSRPQIVVDLLEAIGEDRLHDIPIGVRTICSEQVQDFSKFIHAADRKLPVVLVTRSQQSERPLVSSTRLGSLLAAMAYVYEFDDKFTGRDFSKQMGNEWSVWDGAVRIYWPISADNDTPYRHRRWMPWHIENLRRVGEPESGIFRYICRNACMIPTDILITTDDATRERTRSRLHDLTATVAKTSELDELVALYRSVLEDTEGKLSRTASDFAQAKLEISDLQGKLEAAQSDNNALRQNVREIYEHEGKDIPDLARDSIAEIIDASSTVSDVAQYVCDAFKDRLRLLPAARRDVESSTFERLGEFAEALRILATLYWGMKTEHRPTYDRFLESLAEQGIQYAAHISPTTAGRYGREYDRQYKHKTVDLNEHLKLGTSRDPRFTLRIHFQWDAEDKLVVINYCGWHPKTGS